MTQSFHPTNIADFIAWLENFIVVASRNLSSLNLTINDITALVNLRNSLQAKLDETTTRQVAVNASTQTRRTWEEKVSYYNRIFKAGNGDTTTLHESLGLNATDDHFSANISMAMPS